MTLPISIFDLSVISDLISFLDAFLFLISAKFPLLGGFFLLIIVDLSLY